MTTWDTLKSPWTAQTAGHMLQGSETTWEQAYLDVLRAKRFAFLEKLMDEFLDQEKDPNGLDQNAPGAKMDRGKPNLDLVLGEFARALIEVGRVGTFGAEKYTPRGWLSVPNGEERYASAMLRHYFQRRAGEMYDRDSGLLHAAHEAWNALARLELQLRRVEYEKDQLVYAMNTTD